MNDLAIKKVNVFNVSSGEIHSNKTILIDNGKISKIVNADYTFKAKKYIDGNNKLVMCHYTEEVLTSTTYGQL